MSRRASLKIASPAEQLGYAREIISLESRALAQLAAGLNDEFCRGVQLLFTCRGSTIVSGMGKAGLIAQKIAATLASTGTRSHFLHPAEAVHGDLGRIDKDDLLILFSQSGETEEVVRLLPSLTALGVRLIAVTGRRTSTLGRAAQVTIELGSLQEACSLGLAPSTSTTAMLAIGDALALVTSRLRDFRREDFARFHPGGSLGRKLSKVDDAMRPLAECRIAPASLTIRQVFVEHGRAGRRAGAIMLTGSAGKLAGLFTDSDLARLFETRRDQAIDRPIREVMTGRPCTVPQGSMMVDAVTIMAERKISELPVIDRWGRPLGMIDITDVVALFPEATIQPALPLAATPQSGESPATIPVRKTVLGSSRAKTSRDAAGKTKRARPAIPKSSSRECA